VANDRSARLIAFPSEPLSPSRLTYVLGAVVAVAVGTLVTVPQAAWLVLGLAAAGAAGVAVLRWPSLAPAAFWAVFCVQSTVFSQVVITGLYYPLYAVMAANLLVGISISRVRIAQRLVLAYAAFLVVVWISLLTTDSPLGFAAYQRLFIYVLGLLVMTQFREEGELRVVQWAQVVGTLTVSGWAVYSSFTSGFVHRAGIAADQNVVSFTLGFGLIVVFARLLTPGGGLWMRTAGWLAMGLGVYALLLLASRGVTVAVAVTILALFARVLTDVRRSVPLVVAAVVIGTAVLALPGSDALLNRFDEANLSTANERLPLWQAAAASIADSGPFEVLLGQGFESSRDVILAAHSSTSAVHNAYLQVAVEFGLVGLAAFLALHVGLLLRFWRSRSWMGLYAIGAMTFMLMANLSLDTPDGFLYWVAIGHLMAIAAHHREFAPQRPGPVGAGPETERRVDSRS